MAIDLSHFEKDRLTFGETLGPAMAITEQADADAYFAALVEWAGRTSGNSREETERITRHNLGYYAGYYDNDIRQRVERLFHCAHPIFGAIAANGAPTPEEAFQAGYSRGSASR